MYFRRWFFYKRGCSQFWDVFNFLTNRWDLKLCYFNSLVIFFNWHTLKFTIIEGSNEKTHLMVANFIFFSVNRLRNINDWHTWTTFHGNCTPRNHAVKINLGLLFAICYRYCKFSQTLCLANFIYDKIQRFYKEKVFYHTSKKSTVLFLSLFEFLEIYHTKNKSLNLLQYFHEVKRFVF